MTQVNMGITQYNADHGSGMTNLVIVRDWGTMHEDAELTQVGVGNPDPYANEKDTEDNGESSSDASYSYSPIKIVGTDTLQQMARAGLSTFTGDSGVRIDGRAFGGIYPTVLRPSRLDTATIDRYGLQAHPTEEQSDKKISVLQNSIQIYTDENYVVSTIPIDTVGTLSIHDTYSQSSEELYLTSDADVVELARQSLSNISRVGLLTELNKLVVVKATDTFGRTTIKVYATTDQSDITYSDAVVDVSQSFKIYETANQYMTVHLVQNDSRFTTKISGLTNKVDLQTTLGPRKIKTRIDPFTSVMQLSDTAAREAIADARAGQLFTINMGNNRAEAVKLNSLNSYVYGVFDTYSGLLDKANDAWSDVTSAVGSLFEDINDKLNDVVDTANRYREQLQDLTQRYIVDPVVSTADRLKAG